MEAAAIMAIALAYCETSPRNGKTLWHHHFAHDKLTINFIENNQADHFLKCGCRAALPFFRPSFLPSLSLQGKGTVFSIREIIADEARKEKEIPLLTPYKMGR